MTILLFLLLSTIAMALILAVVAQVLPLRSSDKEKTSPYECGFDPLKSARLPFSFRFFLVAMLFLLFDLEMALLFPLPAASLLSFPPSAIFISFLFMLILTAGLIFEWLKGGLEWAE